MQELVKEISLYIADVPSASIDWIVCVNPKHWFRRD